MTTLFLVRHGSHDLLGRTLAGRMPGVRLNARGRAEARALGERFAGTAVDELVTGPLQRSVETAAPIAESTGLEPRIDPALDEMDFGAWTGHLFSDLEAVPAWKAFNSCRSVTPVPGGETMLAAQARAVHGLERVRMRHPEGAVVVVSHGDVLRAAIAYYLGLSLDLLHRFEIDPASVTTLRVEPRGAVLLRMNDCAAASPMIASR